MNSKDCYLNRRVALLGNKAPLQKGSIVGSVTIHPTLGEVVPVQWDNGNLQNITLRSLLNETETSLKEADLAPASAATGGRKATATDKKVRAKLDQAHDLLEEACNLSGVELPVLANELMLAMRLLEGAIGRANLPLAATPAKKARKSTIKKAAKKGKR